ncbi:MAG: hypothetical protein JXQ91_11130 [Vannielia sp.]|uniref:hypothetical protein n=1 Tax=Rhodobacterales TaxID=204455 RepID=UPI0020958D82|nr:hypothetical protein [Oceanicola sp. 502str15]MCO6384953.1 hypothetical protein [Oceanicola sp. 502str15]
MSDFLPQSVREGLEAARREAERRKSRLKVRDGDDTYQVLRFWTKGFALAADPAPNLRGLVDLFEGERHLYQCLIVNSREEAGERIFEFKRSTAASDSAPLDFERRSDAPVGYLPSS